MLEIILCTYALLVWLLFFKLKVLPWNTASQVGVVSLGLVGMAALIFTINVVTPQSHDVRVSNYVVEIVPRVSGRVIEVPITGNTLVRKGQVLLRLDPEPFEQKVAELKAKLVEMQSKAWQLDSDVKAAHGELMGVTAQLELARIRLAEARALAGREAGSRFDVENYAAQVKQLTGSLDAARAAETRARTARSAMVEGDHSSVAQVRAQLATAEWELEQTVIRAPADGQAINLQVRPGSYAAAIPLRPVMSFVETTQHVIAFYDQNQLTKVEPGNEVEVALKSKPGKIIYGEVESIVWSTAQGQFIASGSLPTTSAELAHPDSPLRFPVKLRIDPEDAADLPMGARGESAIYTDHLAMLHMVRKVIIRVKTKINYLVFKLE
ncbi:HlyD family secretion protein [Pararobbsia alpina]|uniref:Inner membrane protein YiaV n=1 Tax=Pararobbsia alpina TaxID=621374 RepID=A0A6S7C5D4_9BURK|nr:HlyD family secretion protein [Pararobbsia alpina]CAB3781581.1 Inner membrane protein YiaV [Pararobbsia alpina]